MTVDRAVAEPRGTLDARLHRGAERGGSVTFLSGGSRETLPWARLHEEAQGVAGALQSLGVAPRSRVGFLGSTSRELVTAIQGAWLAGAAVTVLPLPPRLADARAWNARLRELVPVIDPAMLVVDPHLESMLGELPVPMVRTGELRPSPWEEPDPDPDRPAVLQLTSGSTRDPRAVVLPHRAVAANIDALTTASAGAPAIATEDDVFVSWLPLYHDLGLFAWLVLPMTLGAETALAPVEEFGPRDWMGCMSELRGTFAGAPNSAYALAARALSGVGRFDLSAWRAAINGSEAVHASTVRSFEERAAAHGYRPSASSPSYGLAEATLAVTVSRGGLRTDAVDRWELEEHGTALPVPGGVPLVRLGPPVPGTRLRVVDPARGAVLPEREVGEVQVAAPSVMAGYFREPEATAAAMDDGWLRTGDLGYLVDGELVIWGRAKDAIIVGGRNIRPEEVEQAAEVEGVRRGNVIAFGLPRTEGEVVVVVAEVSGSADRDSLRAHIASEVRLAVGLSPEDVVLIRRRTLPKTSSGKLQRSLCRARYLAGDLAEAEG